MSDVYRQALAKQEWAEKHIDKLQSIIDGWRKFDIEAFGCKQDAETGDITYSLNRVPVVPSDISLIVGDVLHSLRGALDYVACGMVVAGGGGVTSKTKFPIREVAEDWEVSGLCLVKGAHQQAIEALRRIQPYKGGNYFLWLLNRLNILDKHRLLVAVSGINSGRTLSPNEQATEPKPGEDALFTNGPHGRVKFSGWTTPPVPLHAGQKLLTISASQADEQVGFFFDIAICEPGLTEGTAVTLLLRLISGEVRLVLSDLARFV
jgi:hypothetical protein